MADTDEEQIETIKRWWDEYGRSLIVGVVLALGGVFGYQAWQRNVEATGEAASAIYDDMLEALVTESPYDVRDEEDLATGRFLADRLKNEYGSSSYAHLASLFMAQVSVDGGDLEAAESELSWVIDNGIEASLLPIVKIRLAKVQNALGKNDVAMQTLLSIEPGEHRPSYEEVRGDIHLAMGESVQARESYQRALEALPNPASRPILQMKLDDLEAPEVTLPVGDGEPLAVMESSAAPDSE